MTTKIRQYRLTPKDVANIRKIKEQYKCRTDTEAIRLALEIMARDISSRQSDAIHGLEEYERQHNQ